MAGPPNWAQAINYNPTKTKLLILKPCPRTQHITLLIMNLKNSTGFYIWGPKRPQDIKLQPNLQLLYINY